MNPYLDNKPFYTPPDQWYKRCQPCHSWPPTKVGHCGHTGRAGGRVIVYTEVHYMHWPVSHLGTRFINSLIYIVFLRSHQDLLVLEELPGSNLDINLKMSCNIFI